MFLVDILIADKLNGEAILEYDFSIDIKTVYRYNIKVFVKILTKVIK
ncbi:hypothetical protein JavanS16_0018 [Streptococcus satellite phage Javan16]|nr:Hypothetical Protein GBS85147_0631 [Streptococcus agalactiae]EPT97306.1 hypothetical protein SAG0109_02410 [Streptococcus agalactiae BSU108]EPW73503.1 hypothetical protein SAG0101_07030 [Streptococcus agalactiae BSU451]EPW91372.1 hypothetical protein SAG0141_01965 [Streptococcus agalactiae MRI Z1-023]QBX07617.1 hypothetical protein JavanS16_0018 [Streptococcus satellite phage Javan16]